MYSRRWMNIVLFCFRVMYCRTKADEDGLLLEDSSSASGAERRPCPEYGTVQCGNTTECVNEKWLCDGFSDCPLHEDESSCMCTNSIAEFHCSSGVCITKIKVCDGFADCADNEDEDPKLCAAGNPYLKDYCESPGSLQNGVLAPSGRFHADGETLKFSCLDGWTLDGEEVLKCIKGKWSADLPYCQRECGPLPDIPHGRKTEGHGHGVVVTYSCLPGYQLKLDGSSNELRCMDGEWHGTVPSCEDIDECLLPNDCSPLAFCKNKLGSYSCYCKEGYEGSGKTCTNVNECDGGGWRPCHANAVCTDTDGSYKCECRKGYRGDGLVCSEILLLPYGPTIGDVDMLSDPDAESQFYPNQFISKDLSCGYHFPFGSKLYSKFYFTSSGVVRFWDGSDRKVPYTTPSDFSREGDPVLSAFWEISDLSVKDTTASSIYYQVHERPSHVKKGNPMIDRINSRINGWKGNLGDRGRSVGRFQASCAVVITFNSMPQPPAEASLKFGRINTYQIAIATDGRHSFALFMYEDGAMNWNPTLLRFPRLSVGFNGGNGLLVNIHKFKQVKDANYNLGNVYGNTHLLGRWIFRLDSNFADFTNPSKECWEWHQRELKGPDWPKDPSPCPCSYKQALADKRFGPCNYTYPTMYRGKVKIGHSTNGTTRCVSEILPALGPGSRCAYREDGSLISGSISINDGSFLERHHPVLGRFPDDEAHRKWFAEDILPRYYCCEVSEDPRYCDYYKKHRQPLTCDGYQSPTNVLYPPRIMKIIPVDGGGEESEQTSGWTLKIRVGQGYSYRIFADPNVDKNISFSLLQPFPGANITPGGQLSLKLTDASPFSLTVVASDGTQSTQQPLTVRLCDCIHGTCDFDNVLPETQEFTQRFELAFCDCSKGWSGHRCSEDFDSCQNRPCYHGLSCQDLPPPSMAPICSSCPPGQTGDGFICYDRDECLEKTFVRRCDQICTNTVGSFRCDCKDGYELDSDGRSCRDINECTLGTPCGENYNCVNSPGSYSCVCFRGFSEISPGRCVDVDECLDNPCDEFANCFNKDGSYGCICQSGTIGDGFTCHDLNECSNPSINSCHFAAKCENSKGSYKCTCSAGWTGNGVNCANVDECAVGQHGCHQRAECVDTVGSYSCNCRPGYQGDGFTCIDKQECQDGTAECGQNEECVNLPGSYMCRCQRGYHLSSTGCIDVDECTEPDFHECMAHSYCLNTEGSYRCICDDGYYFEGEECIEEILFCISNPFNQRCRPATCDSHGKNCSCINERFELVETFCLDINECDGTFDQKCSPNAVCSNSVGGYHCLCNEGYLPTPKGFGPGGCTDMIECGILDNCDHNAECKDTGASFQCLCMTGYFGDGLTCLDFDECLPGSNECDEHATCINNDGSYSCVCNEPFYTGNGYHCYDVDECLDANPCDQHASCLNLAGDFKCVCTDGYRGDGRRGSEYIGCMDVNECSASHYSCPVHSLCNNLPGTYECVCEDGFEMVNEKCEDINECASDVPVCADHSHCVNGPGFYDCLCDSGYQRVLENCENIDECHHGNHGCDRHADCIDVEGSYKCECHDGFTGDGFTCEDVNECELSSPCSASVSHQCKNTVGSFTCICKPGGYETYTGSCEDCLSLSLDITFVAIRGLDVGIYKDEVVDNNVIKNLTDCLFVALTGSPVGREVIRVLAPEIHTREKTLTLSFRVDIRHGRKVTHKQIEDALRSILVGRGGNVLAPDHIIGGFTVSDPVVNVCNTGEHDCFTSSFTRCVFEGDKAYSCADCKQGYKLVDGECKATDVCFPDEIGGKDCLSRNFEFCVYFGNGEYTCEGCLEGYALDEENDRCIESSCVTSRCLNGGTCVFHQSRSMCWCHPLFTGPFCKIPLAYKTMRGTLLVLKVNESIPLATYRRELRDKDSALFFQYQHHLCNLILYALTSNYPSISASILRCVVLSFQPSGAIKMYFTIDVHANSTLTSSTMKQAVMNEIRHEQGDYNLHHYEGGGVASIDPLFLDFDDLTCSDPSPCLNGATCRLDDNFGFLCFCEGGFTGSKCEFVVPLTTEMAMPDVEGRGLGPLWAVLLAFVGFACVIAYTAYHQRDLRSTSRDRREEVTSYGLNSQEVNVSNMRRYYQRLQIGLCRGHRHARSESAARKAQNADQQSKQDDDRNSLKSALKLVTDNLLSITNSRKKGRIKGV